MPRLMTILAFACHGAAAAVIVAVAACATRRWRFARDVSGAAAQAGALLLLASVATVFICPVTARDPSMKAVALSQGVSEGLNTAAQALVVSLVAAPVWILARRRLRSSRPPL